MHGKSHCPIAPSLNPQHVGTSLFLKVKLTSTPSGPRSIMHTTHTTCSTGRDAVVYILPIFTLQYMTGVLVQLKHTAFLRIALLSLMLLAISHALSVLDFSCGQQDYSHKNGILFAGVTWMVTRTIIWTLARQPYKRDNVSATESTSIPMACWNVWDLLLNVRGIGWNWSQGIPIRRLSLQLQSRPRFLLFAITRFAFFWAMFDISMEALRAQFSAPSLRDMHTIFDHSLPPIPRYIRTLQTVYLVLWVTYFGVEGVYQLYSAIFVVLFWQSPSQWPPLFDKPWSSTSLSDLWGRRWHQMLRYSAVSLGGAPLACFFGRPGYVLGTFLYSGAAHCIPYLAYKRGVNPVFECGFFVMNAVGILLERAWSKVKGRRVGGVYGWMWTFLWVIIWAVPMVDQWAKTGRFGMGAALGHFRPMSLLSLVLPTTTDKGFVVSCLSFGGTVLFLVYTSLY